MHLPLATIAPVNGAAPMPGDGFFDDDDGPDAGREPWELGPPIGLDADDGPDDDDPERQAIRAEDAPDGGIKAELARERADRPRPLVASLLLGPDLARPLPPIDYLVPAIGLVAGGGAPHLVAGYGFSGKTLTLQAALLALAAGRLVWGGYSGRESRVVHVDLEQGGRLTCRRYQRLALAMGVDLAELGDALAVSVMPPLSLTSASASAWRELMQGRDLMLVDSLRAATGGQEENSSDIRTGLDLLGHLSEATGCRAIVIHHARKPREDAPGGVYAIRGSSAIFDAVDSAYIFSSDKGEPVSVEHVKARTHGELVPGFALVISDVSDVAGTDPRAGLRVQVHGAELVQDRREAAWRDAKNAKAARDAETLRTIIGANPGIASTALRELAGFSGERLAAARRALGADVELRDEKVGRATKTGHYLRPAKEAARGADA